MFCMAGKCKDLQRIHLSLRVYGVSKEKVFSRLEVLQDLMVFNVKQFFSRILL